MGEISMWEPVVPLGEREFCLVKTHSSANWAWNSLSSFSMLWSRSNSARGRRALEGAAMGVYMERDIRTVLCALYFQAVSGGIWL